MLSWTVGTFKKQICVWYTLFRTISCTPRRKGQQDQKRNSLQKCGRSSGEPNSRSLITSGSQPTGIHTPRSLHTGVPSLLLRQVAKAILQPQLPSFRRESSCPCRVGIQGLEQVMFTVYACCSRKQVSTRIRFPMCLMLLSSHRVQLDLRCRTFCWAKFWCQWSLQDCYIAASTSAAASTATAHEVL